MHSCIFLTFGVMPSYLAKNRSLASALLCSLLFGLAGPSGLVPDAEAGSSKDKKKLKKLKKQSNALRITIVNLQAQLAAARRPVPDPVPFVEMVTVGNVGNAADPEDGDNNTGGVQNYGAVPYVFQIGKYEVSLAEYTAFLNAVAAADTNSLYNASMGTDLNSAGIERSGADGSYTYTVIGSGDRPVTYVSWFDCARFCNWLHNGRPTGVQDGSTTERGAYTLDGATSGGLDIIVNRGAKFWIPSEDEWYKAAYHQPSGQGGDGDDYWIYPTGSNTVPGNDIGPLPLANQVNHRTPDNNYSVTESSSYDSNQNYLTVGGSYEGSASFYGTFDQGGNVFEWNDAVIFSLFRGLRGGSWDNNEIILRSSFRNLDDPGLETGKIGFRIASP